MKFFKLETARWRMGYESMIIRAESESQDRMIATVKASDHSHHEAVADWNDPVEVTAVELPVDGVPEFLLGQFNTE